LLKEVKFRTVCEKLKGRERATRFLRSWLGRAVKSGRRYLKRFTDPLRNWRAEFLNYFEGIKRAFGFHKFKHFHLQALMECGGT